jgi:glycosyltransferase involved in cell wall biosynthesis
VQDYTREDVERLRASGLFDEKWYLQEYPDVQALGMDPVEHYLWLGKRLGRSPSRQLGGSNPGSANGDRPVPFGRWLVDRKPHTDKSSLRSPTTDLPLGYEAVAPHIDGNWYRSQLTGDEADVDPVSHFLEVGWKRGLSPNRWFDTVGYIVAYRDVAISGSNPFLHYLRSGLREGRSPNPFFVDRNLRHPDLKRFGATEYGPVSNVLKFHGEFISNCNSLGSICVHVHIFYLELIPGVLNVLRRIPSPYTLLVSIPDQENNSLCYDKFRLALPPETRIIVRNVENRGRDVAPWLVYFKEYIAQSDIFFHFHVKRSYHDSLHRFWYRYLCHTLAGSQSIVQQILSMFAEERDLGLIGPAYWPMLRRQPNFGQTETKFHDLAARLGIISKYSFCPDFPAGSFFWCRTAILDRLFALDIKLADFEEERGQLCGTLGHTIERILGALPAECGYRTKFVAVDIPHEQVEHQPSAISFSAEQLAERRSLSVSVIMPTWNRSISISSAIKSVLNQSIVPKEIIVVDDGSTDDTVSLVRDVFSHEVANGTIIIICQDQSGVSSARNAGLRAATGDIIAYLDTDNTWNIDYISNIVCAFETFPSVDAVYCDFMWHDHDSGKSALYDKDYDRKSIVGANFIDLNVFSHRREASSYIEFDESLKRLVDWDFILNITQNKSPLHIRYVGADYHLSQSRLNNITRTVPLEENMARVKDRHRKERVYWGHEPLQVAVKCPAPRAEVAHQWGDYHFAKSLCAALERQGLATRIDFLSDWNLVDDSRDDVVIVLRGLSRYEPKADKINLLWLISHPDKVDDDELKSYDHVFCASYSYARKLMPLLGTNVSVLLQCSDQNVFRQSDPKVEGPDVLFVGNSRGVDRWMPQVCVQRGLPIAVYGAGWEGRLPISSVLGTHVENDRLGAMYAGAKIVLNDHWPAMASNGFVSNRIFDAGMSGAFVISDKFEGEEMFFGSVVTCRSDDDVEREIRHYLSNHVDRQAKAVALQKIIQSAHTFDHRVDDILGIIRKVSGNRLAVSSDAPMHAADLHLVANVRN